jgi:PIN domain nuclease of toxin-antitoxin system
MRLLLDTHAFLWAVMEPEELSKAAHRAIVDLKNEVYVSAAVGWEIVIKHRVGKLAMPMSPVTYVPSRIAALGFRSLDISLDHTLTVASLPVLHTDPFDRIMIAQAQFESMTFVTRDSRALSYPVRTIEA